MNGLSHRVWTGLIAGLKTPLIMLPSIGMAGFLADYFFRPISVVGLALLGVAAAPWLIQILKRLKVGSFEVETLPLSREEKEIKIEEEIKENEPLAGKDITTKAQVSKPSFESPKPVRFGREKFVAAESAILDWLTREFDAPVRPQVKVGPFYLDAIIDKGADKILVEIKVAYVSGYRAENIRSAASSIVRARDFYALTAEGRRIQPLLVVAYDENNPYLEPLINKTFVEIKSMHSAIMLRKLKLGDLNFEFVSN